jgi:hypothetical protein
VHLNFASPRESDINTTTMLLAYTILQNYCCVGGSLWGSSYCCPRHARRSQVTPLTGDATNSVPRTAVCPTIPNTSSYDSRKRRSKPLAVAVGFKYAEDLNGRPVVITPGVRRTSADTADERSSRSAKTVTHRNHGRLPIHHPPNNNKYPTSSALSQQN